MYPVAEIYSVDIDCRVTANGLREIPLYNYLERHPNGLTRFIPFNFKVKCKVGDTDCTSYDKVLWKVRNVGTVAEKKDCIRGQIKERTNEIIEPTSFKGVHFIECYLIKDGICVAIGHVDIPIGQ